MIFNLSAQDGGGGLRMAHGVATCTRQEVSWNGGRYWLVSAPVTGLGFKPSVLFFESPLNNSGNKLVNGAKFSTDSFLFVCSFDGQGNLNFAQASNGQYLKTENMDYLLDNLQLSNDGFLCIGCNWTIPSPAPETLSVEWLVYG